MCARWQCGGEHGLQTVRMFLFGFYRRHSSVESVSLGQIRTAEIDKLLLICYINSIYGILTKWKRPPLSGEISCGIIRSLYTFYGHFALYSAFKGYTHTRTYPSSTTPLSYESYPPHATRWITTYTSYDSSTFSYTHSPWLRYISQVKEAAT